MTVPAGHRQRQVQAMVTGTQLQAVHGIETEREAARRGSRAMPCKAVRALAGRYP